MEDLDWSTGRLVNGERPLLAKPVPPRQQSQSMRRDRSFGDCICLQPQVGAEDAALASF
jgi:hypothetical protein